MEEKSQGGNQEESSVIGGGGFAGRRGKREEARGGFKIKLNIRRWKIKWRQAALKAIQAGDAERQRMTADQFKHERIERKRIIMLACKAEIRLQFPPVN